MTPRFCDNVIEYGLSQAEVMARTGGYGDRELSKQEVKDMKRKEILILSGLMILGIYTRITSICTWS